MELTLYTEHYYMRMRTHHTALLAYIPCDNMVSISSSICKGICIAYLSNLGTFSVHVRLMVLELASLEKKEERKKMTIFDFFQSSFSRLL